MSKIIIKSALITFVSVIALFLAVYFCVGIFSPLSIAKSYDKLGNYDISVKYYEKQYKKTQKIEDLAFLCEKLDEKNVNKKGESKAVYYLDKLLSCENYVSFCQEKDKNSRGITAKEFFDGKYVVSIYYESGIENALEKATLIIGEDYTEYNPFYILISEIGDNISKEESEKIRNSINSNNEFAKRDLQLLK
ncbi:MAG: hypothetical protein MJ066_01340 [Clostridia bacterium]|nr:hypothetical protein [Clostridia bacterium]